MEEPLMKAFDAAHDALPGGAPSSEELRIIYEGMADGLLIAEIESRRFLRANAAICRMLGYSEEELLGLVVDDIHPPDELPHIMERFRAMSQGEAGSTSEIPCLRKDGSVLYADITRRKLLFRGRECIAGFFRDVSERKAAESALRQSEATFRGLVNNMPDLLLVVDFRATIHFANHDVPGATAAELVGGTGFAFLVPEHRSAARRALDMAFEGRGVVAVDVLDVFDLWWSCRLVPMVDGDRVTRAMIICSDITQRKAAEESLKKEQELLCHMLELLERDRELTAFEIHDGFAQQLTGAQLLLESFEQLQLVAPEEARQAYLEGMRLVRESIHQSRRLVSGLRPPVLGEFGVLPAIEHLIEENRAESGPEVEYVAPDELPRLAQPLENALFRIVEESLTNARRHSRADRVRLEVSLGERWVRVVICDSGVGFEPDAVGPERFGLRGIRERARLLEGRAEIESAPGRGTRIRVELPLVPRMGACSDAESL